MRSNQALRDTYRKLRESQYCLACSRFHDEGSVMHYSVAMVNGSFQHGYFCTAMDCTNYVSEDKPGGTPHSRWVLTDILGLAVAYKSGLEPLSLVSGEIKKEHAILILRELLVSLREDIEDLSHG